jgi:hypothetical protein
MGSDALLSCISAFQRDYAFTVHSNVHCPINLVELAARFVSFSLQLELHLSRVGRRFTPSNLNGLRTDHVALSCISSVLY